MSRLETTKNEGKSLSKFMLEFVMINIDILVYLSIACLAIVYVRILSKLDFKDIIIVKKFLHYILLNFRQLGYTE